MQINFNKTFTNKTAFVHTMVSNVRKNGIDECWVLNKQYLEIYSFKAVRISEFDVQISLFNDLAIEKLFSGIFVLHMKDNIISLFNEVPGTIFTNKLVCYRTLYDNLNISSQKTKNKKGLAELIEKIELIETTFPQLII